jgi:hypothetical protein
MKRYTLVQLILCLMAALALAGCGLGKTEPKVDTKD